jgi:hypothetical protein
MSRALVCLVTSLLIVFSGPLLAQEQNNDLEIKRLQGLLTVINSELKSDLDQILLLQQAIIANARTPLEAQGHSPDAVSFVDVAATQRLAIQRETAINARLDAVLARSVMLDAKKQPLLERVIELSLVPTIPAPKPTNTPY